MYYIKYTVFGKYEDIEIIFERKGDIYDAVKSHIAIRQTAAILNIC